MRSSSAATAGSGSYSWDTTNANNNIARFKDAGNDIGFLGPIDEVRIRATALTDAWVAAEHANQSDPSTFLAVGEEQEA